MDVRVSDADLSDPNLFTLSFFLKDKSTLHPIEYRRLALGYLVDLWHNATDKLLTTKEMSCILKIQDNDYAVKLISALKDCGYITEEEGGFRIVRHTSHQNLPPSDPTPNPVTTDEHETTSNRMTYAYAPVTLCERTDAHSASLRDQYEQSQEKSKSKSEKKLKNIEKTAEIVKKDHFLAQKSLDEILLASLPDDCTIVPSISVTSTEIPSKRGVNLYYCIYEYYAERYADVMNGAEPSKWTKRDFGACKALLDKYGEDRVKQIIDRYFKFKPRYSIKDGYPFSSGYSSVAFLAGEIDADIKNPGRLLQQKSGQKIIENEMAIANRARSIFGGNSNVRERTRS